VRAILVLAGALALAGAAAAAAEPLTVLPKPRFNAPASAPVPARVSFQILSSTPLDPGRLTPAPKPRGLVIEGPDGATAHLVRAPRRYAIDFSAYARPPKIAPGEREFVYEQVVWAKEAAGILYVETAHSTYARSSYGLNAYLNAIDLKRKRLLWRSPALVANADDFVFLENAIVSGYGFTAEPDYLYALDRATGRVVGRVLLPSAPGRIVRRGSTLTVDTYDRRLTIRAVEH
jgi:hypothetical protein